ncbi:hypothetical protein GCM10010266_70670 [Streptomyces griseomycini]|uniref:hypothetical protein n=1 Tax=Streptomyces griseomycini TaxID=66895 RepID=UPI001875CA19|nr:hypothetical protein [Streptomyces griseomycini]GGQ37113.1 hypothetical protein GCM10010266_70670 [Streptomyces griseomycini]
MSLLFLVFTLVLALILLTLGGSAITTGRVPVRWIRRYAHPQLWGAGVLVIGIAVGTVRIAPPSIFMVLFLCGLSLLGFAYGASRPKKR